MPADEYEAFRERLIADLLELKDPDTGEQIITAVQKREDAFPGPAMESAPDLTLTLCDHGFVSVRNRAPVVVKRPIPLGTHHPDGIFIMAGPGVAHKRGADMNIEDTTAIVTHSAGMAVPRNFEGHIPDDLFTAEWLADHPIKKGAGARMRDAFGHGDDMEDSQKAEVLAQLKLLGYLED